MMSDQHAWYHDESTGQYVHDVSVWINAPVDRCFSFWSQFEKFPNVMRHITEVKKTGTDQWHWKAKIDGQHVEWDAVMSEFRDNSIISWRSTSGVKNSGTVNFIPERGGCRLSVHLMYDPPYGIIGDLAARVAVNQRFHDDLVEDLTNFKNAVESGEIDQRFRRAA